MHSPAAWRSSTVPRLVAAEGTAAAKRFIEFFAATIRNRNTRAAYVQAVGQFFAWCERRKVPSLDHIEPVVVAAYIEQHYGSKPTVKQHLAAIRRLFDWLVTGGILPHNPAASVRGPAYTVRRGKTPVLTADEARRLLDSIDVSTLIGLRDRALIAVMVYSFARVSAAVGLTVGDYFIEKKRALLRLHEKGGKRHEVPAHHNVELYLDEYLEAYGSGRDKSAPLFPTVDRRGRLTSEAMTRSDALRMIKRRSRRAGLSAATCCHTFRATGITLFRENGGTIEAAQQIAAHESPRTTKLYDRTDDKITLDEIERIVL